MTLGFLVVIGDLRCLGDFLALVLADSALRFQYRECRQGSRLTDFAGLEGPSKQTCTGFSWTIQILLWFPPGQSENFTYTLLKNFFKLGGGGVGGGACL